MLNPEQKIEPYTSNMQPGKMQILLLSWALLMMTACRHRDTDIAVAPTRNDLREIAHSDTLRVATMYGATSYFLFRDELMGFDYEMAQNLADYLHLNLKVMIAHSEKELQQWLESRKADIVCYNTIETPDLKLKYNYVFPQSESYMVLVQNMDANTISEVTELAGKTISVCKNSVYHNRLKSLYEETGGIFRIEIMPDTLSEDELIQMVGENKISYTVANHQTATLHKGYYRSLDCRMPLTFAQRNGWMIRQESRNLKRAIEKWEISDPVEVLREELIRKYWEQSPYIALRKVTIPKGSISPFDHLFRKYAPDIDWDWRLLAAVAFHESRFDTREVSWAGAAGLMQLMPRTASNFGLTRKTVFDPESNIEAGVQYIKSLDMAFRQISNKQERIKFILAAYNSGPAHILDAMALARKHGKNPGIWFDNVEYYLSKKNQPEFYNDPVVKYGSFTATKTIQYVKNTLNTFTAYKHKKQ